MKEVFNPHKKVIYGHTKQMKEGDKMDTNQKINCTVESCKFNNQEKQKCELKQIIVTPTNNCNTMNCDESMCGSYENDNLY